MKDYPKSVADRATEVAVSVCGGRPKSCVGWYAKVFNAAWEAAAMVANDFVALSAPAEVSADPDVSLARKVAERVLMAKLTKVPVEKRAKLTERIAQMKAGLVDGAPEVCTVLEVIRMIRAAEISID